MVINSLSHRDSKLWSTPNDKGKILKDYRAKKELYDSIINNFFGTPK